MSGWIVRFRRPLMRGVASFVLPKDAREYLRWRSPPPNTLWSKHGHVRYWNGREWTIKPGKAHRYKSREAAEKRGFILVSKEHSLIGELEVVEYVPVSKPRWR